MLLLLSLLSISLPIYRDPTKPIADRVKDLMDNMTLEEKVGQLQQIDGHFDLFLPFEEQHPGSVLSALGATAGIAHDLARKSRLGIPILLGIDAIHGNCFWPGATVFPIQLGIAQSWDEELIEMQGNVTAFETRYTGPSWTFSPVLFIARELRWGRVDETFGEDPFLIGRFATALIRGLQGPGGPNNNPDKLLATAKHYAGYSETVGGRDASEADVSVRKLKSFFLPQFEKAAQAKVGAFMTGYQSIEGLPSTANRWLLRENLKQDWGFEGFLVTDYNNVGYMVENQKIAKDYEEAATIAVQSGNDLMMATPKFYEGAIQAVKSGKLDIKDVEDACRRILETKFKLGLFEDDRDYNHEKAVARIGSAFSRAQSQKAAEESLVLLKNDGYLPLDETKLKKIAVIGPNADNVLQQNGDWSLGSGQISMFTEHPRECTITVVDAFKERFKGETVYEMGCGIETGETADLEAAVKAAEEADAIVVVIGDRLMYYGEMRSTATLELMGGQIEMLRRIKELGKKFIIVMICSKPLIIPEDIREAASAIILQFCPGMLGGRATTGAIFGDINPSGRLTISMPRHVGQQPLYYYQIRGQHGNSYVDMTQEPAYAFGFGLGYSEIGYLTADLDKTTYSVQDDIKVTVKIQNRGTRDAVEVVQVYVSDLVTSATWVDHELKGFARVPIKAGETKTVEVVIPASECSIVNADGVRLVEPGEFEIQVGKASNDILFRKVCTIQ